MWFHNAHLSYNTLHLNEVVKQLSLQTTRCDLVLAEVAFKIDIANWNLLREIVVCLKSHLLRVHFAMVFFMHTLDCVVELVLEHFNGLDWVLDHELGQSWVEVPQLIDVNVKAIVVLSCVGIVHNLTSDLFVYFILVHVILSHLLKLKFFNICVCMWLGN